MKAYIRSAELRGGTPAYALVDGFLELVPEPPLQLTVCLGSTGIVDPREMDAINQVGLANRPVKVTIEEWTE